MIDIIPNWHPIFVHFAVALLSLAVGLFVVAPFVKSPLQEQWMIVARWSLWFGALAAIVTGLTGLYAYNTVAHDAPSHEAMTEHRNWAIATIVVFLSLTAWHIAKVRHSKKPAAVFVLCMVLGGGLLASTAWHGGEAVYRFGLGVMSLPKSEGEGHAHSHGDGGGHGDSEAASSRPPMSDDEMDFSGLDEMKSDDGHDHQH